MRRDGQVKEWRLERVLSLVGGPVVQLDTSTEAWEFTCNDQQSPCRQSFPSAYSFQLRICGRPQVELELWPPKRRQPPILIGLPTVDDPLYKIACGDDYRRLGSCTGTSQRVSSGGIRMDTFFPA